MNLERPVSFTFGVRCFGFSIIVKLHSQAQEFCVMCFGANHLTSEAATTATTLSPSLTPLDIGFSFVLSVGRYRC